MTIHNLRVFGLEDSTCDEHYDGTRTETRSLVQSQTTVTIEAETFRPKMVTVRVGDVVAALTQCVGKNLAWVDDFSDDPIVVTEDLYEVLLAYRRLRRAA